MLAFNVRAIWRTIILFHVIQDFSGMTLPGSLQRTAIAVYNNYRHFVAHCK